MSNDTTQVICNVSGCLLASNCALWRTTPTATRVAHIYPRHMGDYCDNFEQLPERPWGVGAEDYEHD